MTAPSPPMIRRRPRRSNSLKDIGRLLGSAGTTYEDRKERLEAHSAKLNNTEGSACSSYFKIQTTNLFLRQFGVQLIANDRVLHIYEEWPGMDRRLISGSVWDGRAPRSTAAWDGVIRCAHKSWKSAQSQLAAWRGMQFFHRGGGGAAWLDDGPAGGVLRHLKSLALDRGAPVPRAAQRLRLGLSLTDTYGGATKEEKFAATVSKRMLNEGIIALRDSDPAINATCRAHERRELDLDVLIGPRVAAHEAHVRHVLSSPRKKPIDIGSRGAAGDCKTLDPSGWPAFTGCGPGVRRWPHKNVLRVWLKSLPNPGVIGITPIHLHYDDTPQKLVGAFIATGLPLNEYLLWRDRLPAPHFPRWYVHQKIFIHEVEIDKSNIFDQTGAGRDDGGIFNPLGPEKEDAPRWNGRAGRALKRELKKQGIQARVIDLG